MLLRSAFLFVSFLSANSLLAQQQAPVPPPQTARQALIEMMMGGEPAVMKHLTVEVQQLLNKTGKGSYALGMFDSIKSQAGSDLQVFETGPVLFSISQPGAQEKFEVRVENDDLNGDEDAIELSVHTFRDGHEQKSGDLNAFLSHITVSMKRQENVWRLNKIGAALEFPLGDPDFLKQTLLKGLDHQSANVGVVGGTGRSAKTENPEIDFPPEQIVMLLALAERNYAQQHADLGFTCSISELAEAASNFGLDKQLTTGSYKGLKVSLAGCEGKPAGSFQIVAEPVVQGKGAKAYCTDATQNLRVAEDGRGSTCLTSGKIHQESLEGDGMSSIGVDLHVDPAKTKK